MKDNLEKQDNVEGKIILPPSNSDLTIKSFEDILKIVGTNGMKNYIIFLACGLCA